MARYPISFPTAAMDLPDAEIPAVAREAHAVVQGAREAGAYLFSGGLNEDVEPVVVAGDGTVPDPTHPDSMELNGGFAVIDAPSRDAAPKWTEKTVLACRCSQEVREFPFDPLV